MARFRLKDLVRNINSAASTSSGWSTCDSSRFKGRDIYSAEDDAGSSTGNGLCSCGSEFCGSISLLDCNAQSLNELNIE